MITPEKRPSINRNDNSPERPIPETGALARTAILYKSGGKTRAKKAQKRKKTACFHSLLTKNLRF
jgi:hypothetical protein